MLTIGLTGGIGSGKTTVANLFAKLDIDIIDTDQLARDVVQPGTDALRKIIAHFGSAILNPDHSLNRSMLAKKIFENVEEKIWLEKLLHPLIRAKVSEAKSRAKSPYCIVVIPLLIETLPNPDIDRILVVDSPEHLQIARTLSRDTRSVSEIKAIIQAQASSAQRIQAADDIIINDQDVAKLSDTVDQLHRQYLMLSNQHR